MERLSEQGIRHPQTLHISLSVLEMEVGLPSPLGPHLNAKVKLPRKIASKDPCPREDASRQNEKLNAIFSCKGKGTEKGK